MPVTLESPITGTAQTGLTTPTYTVATDTPPNAFSKQVAVTALGGTQTGVTLHSSSAPFTVAVVRPAQFKTLGVPNPSNNIIYNVGKNRWKIITRKGVTPLSGQAVQTMLVTTIVELPAGADLADAPNVRAALSFHIGTLNQNSAEIGDALVTGIL